MKNWTEYTPFEWLLVDAASRYGNDKDEFQDRIDFAVKNILPACKADSLVQFKAQIEPLLAEADEKPMFAGACLAIFDAIHGNESTWQVGQDAASSGPQLLSVLLKDLTGMANCGVYGSHVPDLYTTVTDIMNKKSKGKAIERKVVKKGIVPHIYASEREPMRIFGNRYPVFLNAYETAVPMAQYASNTMVGAWNEHATEHCWDMPDGAEIRIPVINQEEKTIPFGKHSYKYRYNVIGTKKEGELGAKSLSANTTHSYDAYMLRELNRRCNYDPHLVEYALECLRNPRIATTWCKERYVKVAKLGRLFAKNNQISAVIFDYIDPTNVIALEEFMRVQLIHLAEEMLSYPTFEITNIHDEFKTLPKDVTRMKLTYNTLLVETYFSKWWNNTAIKLTGDDHSMSIPNPIEDMVELIMNAPYSIG